MAPESESNEYAEDAAILRFYNIDSFEPDVWIDDAEADPTNLRQETTKQQFDRRGDGPQQIQQAQNQQEQQMTLPSPIENDHTIQASMNTSDPLGLKPSIFEK